MDWASASKHPKSNSSSVCGLINAHCSTSTTQAVCIYFHQCRLLTLSPVTTAFCTCTSRVISNTVTWASPVHKSHRVYSIQGQNHFSAIELGPLLRDIVIAHEVDQVSTRHVVHHHVQVAGILEWVVQLQHPPPPPPSWITSVTSCFTCNRVAMCESFHLKF